jgi:hypothetical protein
MQSSEKETQFVICINNKDYSASLEIRKVYQVVEDFNAIQHQMIRVIDESGEDYLYPKNYFISIELPKAVEEAFSIII